MKGNFRIPMSKPDFGLEEREAVIKVLKSDWPTQGKVTEEFEEKLAAYLSSNVSVVNNGSSALMSALLSNGLKPGDNVLVPAFTFIATSSIPKILGANLIVADIEKDTFSISTGMIENIVKKKKIDFVIAVDIGGLPVDLESLIELSKKHNFVLIEDAAQALGSEYRNKRLGSFEHTTIFSFQITKQITTVEGGCVATVDKKQIEEINQIRDYGRSKTQTYVHDIVGSNFRITDIQSAIGIQQLKKIDNHIETRNKIATEYLKRIKKLRFQNIPTYVNLNSYMLFFVIAENKVLRDYYINNLRNNGIDARISWKPIHKQPCYPELNYFECPNAEKLYDNIFTIPIYNNMNMDEADFVINSINNLSE